MHSSISSEPGSGFSLGHPLNWPAAAARIFPADQVAKLATDQNASPITTLNI
jgi:hypothetical protein